MHTNTAALADAAADILQAIGRLREHEQWGGEESNRRFIDEHINEAAMDIADWLGCDLVKRKSVASVTDISVTTCIPMGAPPVQRLVPRPDPDHRPLIVATDDRAADVVMGR